MARKSSKPRAPAAPSTPAARHARAAQDVGVREWGQLLVERGRQLLARAERGTAADAAQDEADQRTARDATRGQRGR